MTNSNKFLIDWNWFQANTYRLLENIVVCTLIKLILDFFQLLKVITFFNQYSKPFFFLIKEVGEEVLFPVYMCANRGQLVARRTRGLEVSMACPAQPVLPAARALSPRGHSGVRSATVHLTLALCTLSVIPGSRKYSANRYSKGSSCLWWLRDHMTWKGRNEEPMWKMAVISAYWTH